MRFWMWAVLTLLQLLTGTLLMITGAAFAISASLIVLFTDHVADVAWQAIALKVIGLALILAGAAILIWGKEPQARTHQ